MNRAWQTKKLKNFLQKRDIGGRIDDYDDCSVPFSLLQTFGRLQRWKSTVEYKLLSKYQCAISLSISTILNIHLIVHLREK